MTFYEAAVEVLRRTGRPLHFKKITEAAIRDQLLSHVGKTPESTMEDRLDQEARKEDASWIVRTRPGVYTLRAEVLERLNAEAAEREAAEAAERAAREEKARQEAEALQAREAERQAAKAAARAEDSEAEVDEEDAEDEDEEEEDEAADDEEVEAADGAPTEPGTARGRRRRRRRGGRRRGEGREQRDGAAPPASAPAADADADAAADDDDDEDDDEDDAEEAGEPGDEEEVAAQAVPTPEREERGERRGRRRGRGRDRDRDRGGANGATDTLQGERFESIAEAAFAVLRANGRRPMSSEKVAGTVFDKKLVKFHTHDPEATIETAIVTDNQVRSRAGHRPLFAQYRDGRWGLTEWGVSDQGIEKERQILALAGELREEAHEMLGEAVARLKPEAFEMVVMTLLERLDYRNLKVSKRTGDGGTYFSADWRRGFSDLRVCVYVATTAQRTLEADAVDELRETLRHYSAAEGIVVHIGEVSRDAVRESRKEGEPKVTIIDRKTFVRLLVDEGIGVRSFQTPLVMVDTAFIDALQR